MCSGLFSCRQAASAFCCSSLVGGTVWPLQHIWSSGFRNCRPDEVELTANTPSSCGEQHRCIWMITQDSFVFWVLACTGTGRYSDKCFWKGATNTDPNLNRSTNPDPFFSPNPNPLHYPFRNVGIAVVGIVAASHCVQRIRGFGDNALYKSTF